MIKVLINIRMYLWFSFLVGIIYPIFITIVSQGIMKEKAEGSFLSNQGKVRGSYLIAQKFSKEKYFWPRPSAVDYNPLPSGGSNLGPISEILKKNVESRRASIIKAHGSEQVNKIPSDLLFASGSGLDPDISPITAKFQIDRIVKARNLDPKTGHDLVNKIIVENTHGRDWGVLGYPRVNVLELNMALDELELSNINLKKK